MRTEALSGTGLRRILSQLGSQTFLEPKSLTILVLPLMFVTSVTTSNTSDPGHLQAWLLANVLALVPITAVILLARHLWQSRFPTMVLPLMVTIAVSGVIGVSKALLTGLGAVWLSDLEIADINLPTRLWGGVLSGIVALTMASLALLLLQEFQSQRALLLTAKTLQSAPILTTTETKKLSQLSGGISEMMQMLRGNDRKTPRMEAEILRELVDRYVRPLSSSLFADIERNYQSFAVGELLRSAVRSRPPALGLALVFFVSTPRNIEWLGLQNGLVLAFAGAIFIYLAAFILGRLAEMLSISGAVSYIFMGVASTVGVVLLLVSLLEPGRVVDPTVIVALVVWSTQNTLLFGMARVALEAAANNRREVTDLVQINDPDAAYALLLRNRKHMANQMHGEVQSRFMNLVLASQSGEELESKVVIAELEAIQQLIDKVNQSTKTLGDSVGRLVSLWSGIAEIKTSLNEQVAAQFDQQMLFALIEEGVSNAIRHGLADQVSVSLDAQGRLTIEDNGMGPKDGRQGLGARLFAAGSNRWSLTARDQGGSRLELELSPEKLHS